MRQRVHCSLLCAPVEIAPPVRDQPMHEFEIGPIGPRRTLYSMRPSHCAESAMEIAQD